MTIYKLKNWRDERGSELDRAKALLLNKNNSLAEINKQTKIPYQSLRNYRVNIDKLKDASWKRVNVLSQLYDIYEISKNMSQDDVKDLQSTIHDLFKDLHEDYVDDVMSDEQDRAMNTIISQMEQIITSDPNAIYKIYRALNNHLYI